MPKPTVPCTPSPLGRLGDPTEWRESSLQMAPVLGVPSTASLKGFLANFGILLLRGHWLLVTASSVPSALACRGPLHGKAGESLCMG